MYRLIEPSLYLRKENLMTNIFIEIESIIIALPSGWLFQLARIKYAAAKMRVYGICDECHTTLEVENTKHWRHYYCPKCGKVALSDARKPALMVKEVEEKEIPALSK